MARGKQVGRKTTTGRPKRTVNPPSELELSEEETLTEAELFKDEPVEAELRKDEPHEVSSEDGFGYEYPSSPEYATEVEIDEDELIEDELTEYEPHKVNDGFGDEFDISSSSEYTTEVQIDEDELIEDEPAADELASDELTVAKLYEDAVKSDAKNRCIDLPAAKTRSTKKNLQMDVLRKMFVNYY